MRRCLGPKATSDLERRYHQFCVLFLIIMLTEIFCHCIHLPPPPLLHAWLWPRDKLGSQGQIPLLTLLLARGQPLSSAAVLCLIWITLQQAQWIPQLSLRSRKENCLLATELSRSFWIDGGTASFGVGPCHACVGCQLSMRAH